MLRNCVKIFFFFLVVVGYYKEMIFRYIRVGLRFFVIRMGGGLFKDRFYIIIVFIVYGVLRVKVV